MNLNSERFLYFCIKYSIKIEMVLSLPNFTKLYCFDILLKTSAELFVTSETEENISTEENKIFWWRNKAQKSLKKGKILG